MLDKIEIYNKDKINAINTVDKLIEKLPEFDIVIYTNYDNVDISCKKCGETQKIQTWNTLERNSLVRCHRCYTEQEMIRLNNIITNKSSFIIINCDNPDKLQLECTICGSQIERGKKNSEINKTIPCKQCEYNDVIKNIPTTKKLIEFRNNDSVILECSVCGERHNVSKYQIIKNTPSVTNCSKCNIKDLKQHKNIKDKWYIKQYNNASDIVLECVKCKSVHNRNKSGIINIENIECRTCTILEREKTIQKLNITPIDVEDFDNIQCKCNVCNTTFNRKYTSLQNGYGCSVCNDIGMSKGEQIIFKYLTENNINFISEAKLPNVYKYMDFFVPEYDMYIEFDGKQHFSGDNMYGMENHIKTQFSDLYKNEYCKNYRKNLIRISYSEQNNIKEVLDENLCKKGLIFVGKEYKNKQKFLKYIPMKSSDTSTVRNKILQNNKNKCIVTGIKSDEDYAYHLDHKHKNTKSSIVGDEYQGLVRSTLEAGCNMLLGKIENNFHRVGLENLGIDLPDFLENLAEYLRSDPYSEVVDGQLSVYIHPTELPKAPILQKDNYNKLVKELKKQNYQNKIPEYPKSGNMTQPLQKLYEMVSITPEYYKQ